MTQREEITKKYTPIVVFDKYGIAITRFYNIAKQGIHYQILIENKYVWLTEEEFIRFIKKFDGIDYYV